MLLVPFFFIEDSQSKFVIPNEDYGHTNNCYARLWVMDDDA